MEQVDIATREHRTDAYAAINPMQRLPALLLDDGTAIAELIAICRYFEGLDPDPPLFGRGTLECALVEDVEPARRVSSVPAGHVGVSASAPVHEGAGRSAGAGMGLRRTSRASPTSSSSSTANSAKRTYMAGENYSVADITALVAVDFMKVSKLPVPDGLTHFRRWYDAVSARPSAAA